MEAAMFSHVDDQGITHEYHDIDDPYFTQLLPKIRPFTITTNRGAEAPWALWKAIQYIVENKIPGDIVECGVWRGGSILLATCALRYFGDTSREIYLYDTFEGMPKPGPLDKRWDGLDALPTWENATERGGMWGFGGTVEMVKELVFKGGYPEDKFHFIKGMVEDTLPSVKPDQIALLRLDTDLYDSTYHELVHLYPSLSADGILIIDDYGYFQGSRKATDQYIKENNLKLFLHRVDAGVRIAVKSDTPLRAVA
jgi:O-methyltransferase